MEEKLIIMESSKYIIKQHSSQITIKKSKFIGSVYYVDNIEEANKIVDTIKKEYTDASHIPYSYKIDNQIYFTDDGEPSGSAGKPIYNVINENSLNNCLIVIVRYFGGTKLGSSNLLRTFSNLAATLVNESQKYLKVETKLYEIVFSYINEKSILSVIDIQSIKDKEYSSNIKYIIEVNDIDNIKYLLISSAFLNNTYSFNKLE